MVAIPFVPKYRRSAGFLILVSAFASAASASVVCADPGPREFYGKDYASAPQVAHSPLRGEEVSDSPLLKQRAEATVGDGSQEREANERNDSGGVQGKTPSSMQEQSGDSQRKKREGLPRSTLMLFVSSADKQHLRSVLKKAIEVVKKDDALLASIFQIGDYRNVPPELATTLEQYGVVIAPMAAPPEDFGLTQSPAWVFQNEEGFQIVEGAIDIEQFYDSDGNFKEPESFIAPQVPREPSEGKG